MDIGGSVETGFGKILQGVNLAGYINAPNTSLSKWCLFGSGVGTYVSPSSANTSVTNEYRRQGNHLALFPPPPSGDPAIPANSRFYEILTVLNNNTGTGVTFGSGVHSSSTGQPIEPGIYKLKQKLSDAGSFLSVGKLIVEPFQGDSRQHWFLHGPRLPTSPATMGKHERLKQNVTPVWTKFEFDSAAVFGIDIPAFLTQVSKDYSGINQPTATIEYVRDDVKTSA